MVVIGACDDRADARKRLRQICDDFFKKDKLEYQFIEFENGDQVLDYCKKVDQTQIDLLFLDVEMPGINGIQLKEQLLRKRLIWRIVFVTGHKENIFDAFGQKTIGFIDKPAQYEKVERMLNVVIEEIKENVEITFIDMQGRTQVIKLEDIAYFKAAGSYTEIVMYSENGQREKRELLCKRLGEFEKKVMEYSFVRVHKSYLVNLANVTSVSDTVSLYNLPIEIPLGRVYKEKAKMAYYSYGKGKIRKRI